ncbi:hypothetical protein Mnod_4994 [Methylobacterium nodulans ORS 2060]|uniref:Uncharacterized protein n=1 Tax=Methylobacterium nodulans (strain LMG 21967 / CNCM I-2342 / ORS 2060) TaxID=460265 RepID=B8IIH1_METNO|nr:hypothetical protein Mnod_4994 [Methylobacterium nodulans ORS 2060]
MGTRSTLTNAWVGSKVRVPRSRHRRARSSVIAWSGLAFTELLASVRGRRVGRHKIAFRKEASFYHTSEHDRGDPMRSVSTVVHLSEATNDSLVLVRAALHGVDRTWREPRGAPWRYSKAGVITTDLVPLVESPRALFGALERERGGALMAAMDACNRRFGRGTVVPARAGLERKRTWATKFERRTPRYTTHPAEVPVVTAMAAAGPEIRPSSL